MKKFISTKVCPGTWCFSGACLPSIFCPQGNCWYCCLRQSLRLPPRTSIPHLLPTVLMDLLLWRLSWEQPQGQGINPPCCAWRTPMPPIPEWTLVHSLAWAPARRHRHCPCEHPSRQGSGWSQQGCSQWAAGMWPPCFVRRRRFVHVGASLAMPAGRKIRGWTAACCGRWYRNSLGKFCLGAEELHCNSCLPTTFLLQRALNDGAEIVQWRESEEVSWISLWLLLSREE